MTTKQSTGSNVLDDIIAVIGEDAAFALATEFIGERVYIPKTAETEPRISQAIGVEMAERLRDAFYCTTITFPVGAVIERQVLSLVAQGLPKREVARRLKIREARVYAILKRVRDRGSSVSGAHGAGQPGAL